MDRSTIVAAVILAITYVGYQEYVRRYPVAEPVRQLVVRTAPQDSAEQEIEILRADLAHAHAMLDYYTKPAGTCYPMPQAPSSAAPALR
ncbi:hypothetical protein FHW69_002818 [Luteibacter sp. Sphag1AF]|uniref:hypothetical protein n=1 Tax=Luteibacter sp. Sphag1AF TaxID=2587031 RepID=UPI00161BD2F2|nr:hypothetical protein [Luteibacter sp. Sphag1AF]MBB3228183.1 hypothetical protein [Luteibacter sp. Sphag1AF]